MTQSTTTSHKETVFNALLGYRTAMYKLMDLGLVSDDSITFNEQRICQSADYEFWEYNDYCFSPVNDSFRTFMADFFEGAK